ncbi:MAG: hypothetical protein HPY76_12150 [Anaerolineae bacterium]|nr:hypothetical protein [Anaerolineae bacterium]
MNLYAVLIGLGASLGMWQVHLAAPSWHRRVYLNAALLVLLGALLGARLVTVVFYWGYYRDHFWEVFQLWQGGLSWVGALAGGALTTWLVSRRTHISWKLFADHLSPLILPLSVMAWLGCWQVGCAYGPLAGAWGLPGVPSLDDTGQVLERMPLQLLAAATLPLVFGWVESRRKAFRCPGMRAGAFGLALSLHLLLFTAFRADPAPRWFSLRPETWAAIAFSLLFAVVWALCRERGEPCQEEQPSGDMLG